MVLSLTGQLAEVQIVGQLPAPVTNNAVCEGFVDGTPFLYSFGGIDSTLSYDGIHLHTYRYNTLTGESEILADMPDTLGKVAAAASRIGDIIYIIGGYHVFADGSELSSTKVHRFDTQTNAFLADGADIPVAIDDQVQVVWRDSLIYVVTGWSDVEMVTNVQIYNPAEDVWLIGDPVPDLVAYKAFGASGSVYNDTLYYFGGAVGSIWTADSRMRKGVINADNPTEIDWSIDLIDPTKFGYRMAVAQIGQITNWIGGSNVTYNYDGVAYNGSGIVSPNNRILSYWPNQNEFYALDYEEIPMDLRGIARVSEFFYYLGGGMLANQEVTNNIYQLQFALIDNVDDVSESVSITVFPNPVSEILFLDQSIELGESYSILTITGQEVIRKTPLNSYEINVTSLENGMYSLIVYHGDKTAKVRFVVER